MKASQYAVIADMLPRLSDDDLETLRKVIEQMQQARLAEKRLAGKEREGLYVA
jgi:hypothetical protein